MWLTVQFADPTSTTIFTRLPSLLAGSFLPVVVYGLGRELFGRAQGLLASLLVALCPALIEHSRDLRPYSLMAFFTSVAVYCLLVAKRTFMFGGGGRILFPNTTYEQVKALFDAFNAGDTHTVTLKQAAATAPQD